MNKLKLVLSRLGVDVEKISDDATEADLQKMLFEAINGNKTFQNEYLQPAVDAEKGKIEKIIVGKLKKAAKDAGYSVEEEENDVKNIVSGLNEHLKGEYGKGDKDKQKALEAAQTKLREIELQYSEYKQAQEQKVNEIESAKAQEIANIQRNFDAKSKFYNLTLTDEARKAADFYHEGIFSEANKLYDWKEKDGKLVALKKGTEEPEYLDGKTDQKTYDHFMQERAEALKIIKVTDANGGGDPDKPKPGQNGGGGDPKVYNPYDN